MLRIFFYFFLRPLLEQASGSRQLGKTLPVNFLPHPASLPSDRKTDRRRNMLHWVFAQFAAVALITLARIFSVILPKKPWRYAKCSPGLGFV